MQCDLTELKNGNTGLINTDIDTLRQAIKNNMHIGNDFS